MKANKKNVTDTKLNSPQRESRNKREDGKQVYLEQIIQKRQKVGKNMFFGIFFINRSYQRGDDHGGYHD